MVAAHCQAEKLLGYLSHSHCESKNNPVGCRWAQPGRWAYWGQEARRIKHVLGRIKTGPSRQPTPQGTLLYGGWGWDVGICDLSWGQSCSFWGFQLCCYGLNPELGKTVPRRHLNVALETIMWAKQWRKVGAVREPGQQITSSFCSVSPVPSTDKAHQCASWQRKHFKGPYPFSQIRQQRVNL